MTDLHHTHLLTGGWGSISIQELGGLDLKYWVKVNKS